MKRKIVLHGVIFYTIFIALYKLIPSARYQSNPYLSFDYNWMPFLWNLPSHLIILLLLNSAFMLPFGLLVEYTINGKWKWVFALVPLALELLQPVCRSGVYDTTTVLFLYFGFFAGVILCKIGKHLLTK